VRVSSGFTWLAATSYEHDTQPCTSIKDTIILGAFVILSRAVKISMELPLLIRPKELFHINRFLKESSIFLLGP
jgi:hypothetical protein